tara:strand:- start:1074 stop:1922 length:849 start_codon:yes stop_codon:yes gene_type:complete
MLHEYKIEFEAGNHKGGKTYIARLLSQTNEALMAANNGEPMQPSMEVVANELGLVKEGITAEYFDIMCSKYSSGVDDRVKYLFRKIGRYVQDNGCWPSSAVLRHWPEYIAMKGHHVKHPKQAYTHHRDLGKNKLKKEPKKTASDDYVGLNFRVPKDFAWEFRQAALSAKKKQNEFLTDCLAESKPMLETNKLEKQIQDGLAQQMAKEAKEAYSHLSKECKRLRDVLMMLESRVLELEESNGSALEEVRELYQLIDEATAPTPVKSNQGGFMGLLRGKGGEVK